jgi:hypothetical protein
MKMFSTFVHKILYLWIHNDMNHVCLLKGVFLPLEENIMWKLFVLSGVRYLQKGLNHSSTCAFSQNQIATLIFKNVTNGTCG